MSTDPILAAIADLVFLEGGLAELEEEQTLNILLTKNIAKALELPEEVSLSTQIDNPNSLFVTYHSELLQKFSELLGTRGLVASLGVQFTGHFKNSGFDKMVLQKIIPHNGLIKFVEAKRQNTPYLWCHVAYTAEADEKRIGMISFFVNGFFPHRFSASVNGLLSNEPAIPVITLAPAFKSSALIGVFVFSGFTFSVFTPSITGFLPPA